jgi:hypothetical protein
VLGAKARGVATPQEGEVQDVSAAQSRLFYCPHAAVAQNFPNRSLSARIQFPQIITAA